MLVLTRTEHIEHALRRINPSTGFTNRLTQLVAEKVPRWWRLVLGVAVAVLARAAVATVEAVLSESAVAATARTPSSKWQSYTRRRNPFSYRQLYTTSIQLQRLIQSIRTVAPTYNR